MKYQAPLRWLIPLVGALALVASAAGLFWETPGRAFEFQSLRGEMVTMAGHGLYRYDSASAAAQEQGQDVVTLLIALPVLAVSTWLAFRGSLRGRLLLAGTLAYFLYTYLMMTFETAYNPLFLVYVALSSSSLYAFVLCLMSFDLADLPGHFSPKLPRKLIAGVLFAVGGFLTLAWLGRIVPPLMQGKPPLGLDATTTLVIQAMDLGIIVPAAILSGVLLLRRSAWGYLLASVAVMKFLTYGLAVCAMGINEAISGVADSAAVLAVFLTLTAVNAAMAVVILRNVDAKDEMPGAER